MCYTGGCPYERGYHGDMCACDDPSLQQDAWCNISEENKNKDKTRGDIKMNEQLQTLIDGLQFTNLGYEQEIDEMTERIKQLKEMIRNNDKKIKTLETMKEVEGNV